MGLHRYVVRRDKFEFNDPGGGFRLAFPCCVCIHRDGTDQEEPCRTCDHNANAVASSSDAGNT